MRQCKSCGIYGHGSEHNSFSFRHGEVLHSHLLQLNGKQIERHACQVTDDHWGQHGQHPWTGWLQRNKKTNATQIRTCRPLLDAMQSFLTVFIFCTFFETLFISHKCHQINWLCYLKNKAFFCSQMTSSHKWVSMVRNIVTLTCSTSLTPSTCARAYCSAVLGSLSPPRAFISSSISPCLFHSPVHSTSRRPHPPATEFSLSL